MIKIPKVAVLLAAYNGEDYIDIQIKSILQQDQVEAHLFINIDSSSDKTLDICEKYIDTNRVKIISSNKVFGSANKNFLYLIKNLDIESFDAVALSDQDDIWLSNKLIESIRRLNKTMSYGYSSNVIAFWESKKNRLIKKSLPQKKYDFIFESPGPGCTFLLHNDLFLQLKRFLIEKDIDEVPHHDWWIYTWARINGYRWTIDEQATLLYRQHANNQVGANHGFLAKIKRIRFIINKSYRDQVNENLLACGMSAHEIAVLRRRIARSPLELRRNKLHSLIIYALFIFNFA